MITKLIMAILNLITKIVSIILLPLDLLVQALLPNMSDTLNNIVYYLNLPSTIMSWLFDLFNIPPIALGLIVSYWIYKYAVVGATSGVKMIITLYQRFKP